MPLRRIKTYTAQTGFVHEYYFVGQREALEADVSAIEYIFDVISDRRARYSVSVFVRQDGLNSWAATHDRSLSEAERYAAAKLRLQQGFDEIGDMLAEGRTLIVDAGNIEEILAPLGLS
ncbi:MAG TPA: hypothetical protein VFU86_09740 [Terriglobales bacterium]|nr:hypothetical protein [Terriglobales bacterium]